MGPAVTGKGTSAAEAADVARTVMLAKYEGYAQDVVRLTDTRVF